MPTRGSSESGYFGPLRDTSELWTWEVAHAYLQRGRKSKSKRNVKDATATTIREIGRRTPGPKWIAVRYYDTDVVTWVPGHGAILNHGNWFHMRTTSRMEEFSQASLMLIDRQVGHEERSWGGYSEIVPRKPRTIVKELWASEFERMLGEPPEVRTYTFPDPETNNYALFIWRPGQPKSRWGNAITLPWISNTLHVDDQGYPVLLSYFYQMDLRSEGRWSSFPHCTGWEDPLPDEQELVLLPEPDARLISVRRSIESNVPSVYLYKLRRGYHWVTFITRNGPAYSQIMPNPLILNRGSAHELPPDRSFEHLQVCEGLFQGKARTLDQAKKQVDGVVEFKDATVYDVFSSLGTPQHTVYPDIDNPNENTPLAKGIELLNAPRLEFLGPMNKALYWTRASLPIAGRHHDKRISRVHWMEPWLYPDDTIRGPLPGSKPWPGGPDDTIRAWLELEDGTALGIRLRRKRLSLVEIKSPGTSDSVLAGALAILAILL